MTLAEVAYEDQLLRWLTAQRNYPWNNEPEPGCPPGFENAQQRVKRDFFR